MATLAQFLKTGSLGPIVLGMGPNEVVDIIGEPQQESAKKNPLLLKYGSLQLIFWRHSNRSQLRDICINFLPSFEALPPLLTLDDFRPRSQPTEEYFKSFTDAIEYPPVHVTKHEGGREFVFLSGVVANFVNGLIDSIRITQKEKRESSVGALSDLREPSQKQILEMVQESERALQIDARRSALVMAWAALEASLRRVALLRGLGGQIGVQPTILIRELLSAGALSTEDGRRLEELRQLRTAAVHGLSPVEFPTEFVHELNGISRSMLTEQKWQ